MKSVVKIFVQKCKPNFAIPWQRKHQLSSSGSGFVISDQKILTNAHVVSDQKSVRVRKHGDPKKFTARVLHVGHECDIALLSVEEEKFWEGLVPLEFGGVPQAEDEVSVVGFPEGGDNISVTHGVVSRVDIMVYCHSEQRFLAIQIDAAINSGNSGGPALKDEQVVGIAFESLHDADNIGYIIPTPIIHRFLQDLNKNGHYSGFCNIGLLCQNLESDHMRKYLRLADDESGVLVTGVEQTWCASKHIFRGDVLLAINGVSIADDGTIPFHDHDRISWTHLIDMTFPGDVVEVTVLRDGQKMSVNIISGVPPRFLRGQLYDIQPSYVVYSGLVFTKLTEQYLADCFGREWRKEGPIELNHMIKNMHQEKEGQEVVILGRVLASEVTAGYEDIIDVELFRVNNIPIRNLSQLCKTLDEITYPHIVKEVSKSPPLVPPSPITNMTDPLFVKHKDPNFIHFELGGNHQIVLEIKKAWEKHGEMLESFGIGSPRSSDLPQQPY